MKLQQTSAAQAIFCPFALPLLVFGLLVLGNFPVLAQRSPEGLPANPASATLKAESLPLPSASARDLYAKHRDRLVQVRLLLKSASEQSIAGSGFVVRADDGDGKGALLVTNYHVVSALAIDPAKYRIELRQTNDAVAEAELIAIDVAHDLAVLRTKPAEKADAPSKWRAKAAFDLRDTLPAQGEKIFSLGHPMGVAFLISEGIYNGLKEQQLYDHMVFSGALNPGMSGGPAIDANGRVAGVNVSGLRNAQLLNFLVPISHARALIADAKDSAPRSEWRTEVARQLLAHQEVFTAKLFGATNSAARAHGFGSQRLAGRTVQTLDDSLTRCNASANTGDGVRYRRESLTCQMKSGVFVHGTLQTGAVAISHHLYTNVSLATPQFLNMRAGRPYMEWMDRRGGGDKTREECHDAFLRGTQREFRVSMCTHAYRKFPGLYDVTVRVVQIDDARQHLESRLHVSGVSWDNGQKVAKAFVERLQ